MISNGEATKKRTGVIYFPLWLPSKVQKGGKYLPTFQLYCYSYFGRILLIILKYDKKFAWRCARACSDIFSDKFRGQFPWGNNPSIILTQVILGLITNLQFVTHALKAYKFCFTCTSLSSSRKLCLLPVKCSWGDEKADILCSWKPMKKRWE
jgi:hypothetical protein